MNGCSAIGQKEKNTCDKWAEVMKLAERYGFIRFAYGGVALLSIEEEAMKER
jgi:hypothetical protein